MKKLITLTAVLVAAVSVFAQTKLKVGATPEPHAAFLNLVKEDLKKEGVDLVVVEFTDYVIPNEALESGEIDANFFQHLPYLESFNKEKGFHLVNAGGIHVEPIALYSKKVKSLADIKVKGTIAIPNDPTNEGRALLLLQAAGLIELDKAAGITATVMDIKKNPKKIKFKEIEAATLPRVLADFDAAVINGNYAIPAGLSAIKDGLYVEGKESPYVNIVAVKDGRQNEEAIQKVVKALQGQKIKDYVKTKYPNGEVVPVN